MLRRDIADELYSIVVKRYHEERPEVQLTEQQMDNIWYSVYGALTHRGKEAAYEYAKTTILLW